MGRGFAPAKDEQGRKYRTLPTPPLLFKIKDWKLGDEPFSCVSLDGRSSVDYLPIWYLYNPEVLHFTNMIGEAAITVAGDGSIQIDMPAKAALLRYEPSISKPMDIDAPA